MCKKVNFSISNDVDAFLTNAKEVHGISKSKLLSMLVVKYGDKMLKDLQKYERKEQSA